MNTNINRTVNAVIFFDSLLFQRMVLEKPPLEDSSPEGR